MRASGGKATAYAGGDSNVMKEAHERKRGGRVHHGEGDGAKERHDRKGRARGGKAHHPGGHKGRARGGSVGADKHPLSSASKIKEVVKGEYAEDSPKSD
jgi:hypothetical protein